MYPTGTYPCFIMSVKSKIMKIYSCNTFELWIYMSFKDIITNETELLVSSCGPVCCLMGIENLFLGQH
jgi:hypothetical protein